MRILTFSTDDFIPPAGGAEIALGEITKRLPEAKFDLFCARLRPHTLRKETLGNVNIFRIGFGISKIDKALLALLAYKKALRFHKENPYDAVWAIEASFGGFAATSFKKVAKIPYLLTLQEGKPVEQIEEKTKFFSSKFKNIFSRADGLQAISKYLFNWGHNMGFKGKIKAVIPNGVDVKNFSQKFTANKIENMKNSFSFPTDARIITTVSRLVYKNGVEDIVDSLKLLPEYVHLVIVGFGPLEKKLHLKVKNLGLEKRVRFLGIKKHEELPLLLQASDIFIRPSISEGLGSAFLEAMAAGLIIIGTPVGGIPDFLEDGKTGFFCKPKDRQSIALTIKKVLGLSDSEKDAVRLNALNIVKDKHNWDVISYDMGRIFEQLTAN